MTERDADLVNDLMAQIEYQRQLIRDLSEAGTHLAWKYEWRDKAYFNQSGDATNDRRAFGIDGPYPWRGIMDPALLHLINVLEEYGLYDGLGEAENA